MAFVLVQHLDPKHKSILTTLIGRYTNMEVYEVMDRMEVKPNCVYVIPPNRNMIFREGLLHLQEPSEPHGHRTPIDFFFRSLAEEKKENTIGIVLSGSGSDGTLGLRAIKAEGGMVMAQSPESSEYDSMPRSIIDSGLADYVLPPEEMPVQLFAYVTQALDALQERIIPDLFVGISQRILTGGQSDRPAPATILPASLLTSRRNGWSASSPRARMAAAATC